MNFILFLFPIILLGTKDIFLQNNHIDNKGGSMLQAKKSIPDSTNMINYNIKDKTTSYETFDENYYTNRNASNNAISLISEENTCAVLGNDDRTEVSNPKESPYLQTAYVRTVFDNIYNKKTGKTEPVIYTSTAFLEGPNLAVTAGHCVYKDVTTGDYDDGENNPRFPDRIEYYFGCSGKSDYQQGSNYQYYAEAKIINIENHYYKYQNNKHDWAAIELDRNIGNTIGWYGKTGNFTGNDTEIYSFGYPGDKTKATMWKSTGTMKSRDTFIYTYDMDTEHGQSGSPIFMKNADGNVFVCGIHTTTDGNENYGTIINLFIYSYLNSYVTSYTGAPVFHDYLDLSISGKEGPTWKIRITNNSSHKRTVSYNEKMCFDSDAKNWSKLDDIKTITINAYSSEIVPISKNWFATTIAVSFVTNEERLITYANNLKIDDNSSSLSQYTSLIQL